MEKIAGFIQKEQSANKYEVFAAHQKRLRSGNLQPKPLSYIKSLNNDTHQTAIGIINYLLYCIL